jgi:hypothetical protein
MTVALGILAADCQIIAADTQHSADTEKLGQGKIATHVYPRSGTDRRIISITGSGDSFYLEALQTELADTFSTMDDISSMGDVRVAFSRCLKRFYKEHIALTPDLQQRPEVELIIAARSGELREMWVTKRNRISVARSPVAVGLGGTYAQSLLGNMCLPQQPETAMLLAAYVVFLVKQRNLWVGMDTQVLCLDDSIAISPRRGFTAQVCRQLEEMFRQYIGVEARILHRFLGSGYPFCEAASVQGDIEILRERLDSFLHPRSASNSENSQT